MIKSFIANSTVNAYSFVKFNGEKVENASTATDVIVGVSDTVNYTKGDAVDIFMTGEEAQIISGGAFDAGDALTSDSDGYAVKALAGDNIGAIALAASTAKGELVYAMVQPVPVIASSKQE